MQTKPDALLVLSFGGPEGPEDVMPFLRNVTRGRGIPDERLATVASHYQHFGGVSPINAANRALVAAIEDDFAARDIALPVYWGNRNWHPFLADTLRQMTEDGVRHALVLATSATAGYSSCRQYFEDMASASAEVGPGAPVLTKLRHFFDHPGYIEAHAAGVREALTRLPNARLVCTAHSIPVAMDAAAGPNGGLYLAQQDATALLVAAAVGQPDYDLVWQSRSGPPSVPWLAPDVNDHLRELASAGVREVVLAPTGFLADHMEVIWDLDVEAAQTAAEVGIRLERAPAAGTHPSFVAAIRELVEEHLTSTVPPLTTCGPTCCLR
ncbi:MAG TPA: ferrochelatase [Jatrophihabitans sp.]|jgi:ferrochelatase